MGVVKLADYRPQLEVVEHRVADSWRTTYLASPRKKNT